MEQILTGVSAQRSSSHSRADAATVADGMRHPVCAAASGSSSSRSQRSMRSACCSRPGTGDWAVGAHCRAGQGALAVAHEEIHAGLPQDEPAGSGRTTRGTARQSQYPLVQAEEEGSG